MSETIKMTPYVALGGELGIQHLVHRFYQLMDELPEAYGVRQIHPASLEGSGQSLCEFLSGWLGGPQLYMEKKGHPRLRMRHAPYAISQAMRDEWMHCMTQSITEQVRDKDFRAWLIDVFAQMADHLMNTDQHPRCPS